MERIGEILKRCVANTYTRQPLVPVRARGMLVEDITGKRYLDFVGGIAVCALGHCHPEVVRAVTEQARHLMHVSNLYYIKQQGQFAELLAQVTPPSIEQFFFCNSGAEANEGALKLAVKHTKRSRIVVMEGSFHGRTALTVGATWKTAFREPYRPLIPEIFEFVPFGNLEAVEMVMSEQVAAILVEPIQGEGGVRVPPDDFLPGLRELCNEHGALLICDEIQTGLGRTGKWFACEHWGVEPDIISMAKALGGGFPVGCFGARREVMESFSPGDHASTFGGNPLACAAGIATIKTLRRLKLPQRAAKLGEYFLQRLKELKEKHDCIKEVRGKGLLLGMELESKELAEEIVTKARERGFLINLTAERVLRFTPPLIVERYHISNLVEALHLILGG
jgi:predicted acetylornithine/succinylornithine family transaminase